MNKTIDLENPFSMSNLYSYKSIYYNNVCELHEHFGMYEELSTLIDQITDNENRLIRNSSFMVGSVSDNILSNLLISEFKRRQWESGISHDDIYDNTIFKSKMRNLKLKSILS